MPALTRRRSPHHRHEYWLIHYGDAHVGAIAERTGNPHDTEPWEWRCGFYPGSSPGECTSGTAETFDQARADFEAAWKVFLANRTVGRRSCCPRPMKFVEPDRLTDPDAAARKLMEIANGIVRLV